MLKTTRTTLSLAGLLGVATMLVMATEASSAFANSEFKAAGGANPAGIKITGSGGLADFLSEKSNLVTCEGSKSIGEFVSALLVHVEVTYEKCTIKGATGDGSCENIKTNPLTIKPGTIPGGARGVLISPIEGTVLAVVKCSVLGTGKIEVSGSLVCINPEPGVLQKTGLIECKESAEGVQENMEIEVDGELHSDDLLSATALFVNEKEAQITDEMMEFGTSVEQT